MFWDARVSSGWCWRLACYDIIGNAQGAISSSKGQHVTRVTCCDWSHTYAIGVTLMRLESHWCNWIHTYAAGVTYWWCHLWLVSQIRDWRRNMCLETQLCNNPSGKFTRGHAHQNSIYSRPFWSDFSFPLMYYFTFMQATRYIITHTGDSINQHYRRNSYTISLGWYLIIMYHFTSMQATW